MRDSGVKFVCCDMPEPNDLTIGVLAVVAQAEAQATSRRTKDALQMARKRIEETGQRGHPEVRRLVTRKAQLRSDEPGNQTSEAVRNRWALHIGQGQEWPSGRLVPSTVMRCLSTRNLASFGMRLRNRDSISSGWAVSLIRATVSSIQMPVGRALNDPGKMSRSDIAARVIES
nr:hypothetical protein [Bradyrhizobium sp. Rc3b]